MNTYVDHKYVVCRGNKSWNVMHFASMQMKTKPQKNVTYLTSDWSIYIVTCTYMREQLGVGFKCGLRRRIILPNLELDDDV